MKHILLLVIACLLCASPAQAIQPATPGTPAWTLANQDNIISNTIETKIDDLDNLIASDFDSTFTALDDLLAKICTVQSQAELLATQVNSIEVNFNNDASKLCAIESKMITLEQQVAAIDTQNTFTALEELQTTLCSKIEQLNTELIDVEDEITNITQTEIEHTQTIASKLNVIDNNVNTINSIFDNITFDVSLNTIDSLIDVIDVCLQTIDSKLGPLESAIVTDFAGTFTALDANLQKACTIESLVDAIPMSFMADLSGVYTSLTDLKQEICTIESKVDNLDMNILTIESEVDILNSTIDQTLAKLCTLESKTDVAACSECFSLLENIGTNLSNDCSSLEELNDNQLLEKTCTIDSNLDIIINDLESQNSKLEVINSEIEVVESKICAIEMNNTTISKLNIIDSKIDSDLAEANTICSTMEEINNQLTTIESKIDPINQTMQTIESKVCNLPDETITICSNLDVLNAAIQTIDGKLDELLSTTNVGGLCPDFGNTGTVTTDFGTLSIDGANGVLVQTDNKIVAAGRTDSLGGFDFALARYNTDGSLDSSFGTAGLVVTAITPLAVDEAEAILLQEDSKLIAVGHSMLAGVTSIALVRYNSDGSLDASFGTGGIVTTAPTGPNMVALANSGIIQDDGKIVVTGGTGASAATNFHLVRYNTDGSLDTSFGVGGRVTTDLGGIDVANALLLQPDGKLVAVGNAGLDFAAARYNTDGTLDTAGFGGGSGFVTTDLGGADLANAGVLQPNGKIIAAGSTDSLASLDFAMVRYNTDGTLDTQFGTNGLITTPFAPGLTVDIARAAVYMPNDRLIAAGDTDSTGGLDFALACYELGINPLFFIPPQLKAICASLELISTSSLISKLDNIESIVCTIESNMDIVGGLIGEANMKAIDLETDFADTWTILDTIENKLCTSESKLENANDNLSSLIDIVDFSAIFTVVEAIQMKACTVDSKVDVAISLVSIDDVDFSGVFTALDALESKVCLIDDLVQTVSTGIFVIRDALGTPIYESDLPLTIDEPGRYYLAENVSSSSTVITIATDNVTLDLNGFFLESTANAGVQVNASLSNTRIENGAIQAAGNGISADTGNTNIMLNDVAVESSTARGIDVNAGENIFIFNCSANNCGDDGVIFLNSSNMVINNVDCNDNGGDGLILDSSINGCILNSTAERNSSDGFCNPNSSSNIIIEKCKANENTFSGVDLSDSSEVVVRNSYCANNMSNGVNCNGSGDLRAVIIYNTFISNDSGVFTEDAPNNNVILFNVAINNTDTNFNNPAGTNTYLGNFAFNADATGDPNNTNYDFSGSPSNITGKFVTIEQNGAFPATEPTEWHNINMLP